MTKTRGGQRESFLFLLHNTKQGTLEQTKYFKNQLLINPQNSLSQDVMTNRGHLTVALPVEI